MDNPLASVKSSGYFGRPAVERAPRDDDDEFEGTVLDEELLAFFSGVDHQVIPDFWREVWLGAAGYGELSLDKERRIVTFKAGDLRRATKCPGAAAMTIRGPAEIFCHSTDSARARGWDWSGDTDVWVFEVPARSFEEACVAVIVGFSAFARGHGSIWLELPYTVSFRSFPSWSDFWTTAVHGANDLPRHSGSVQRALWLHDDGNHSLVVAETAPGSLYYVVDYATS